MEDVDCDICFINFDENEHIPKILECGHTFCQLCIKNFQQQRKCPQCSKDISVRDPNSFPTNYYLIKTINAYKNFASSSWNIKNEVEKFRSSFVLMQEHLREYVSTYNEVTEAISTLDTLNPKLEIVTTLQCLSNCKITLSSAENFLKLKKKDIFVNIKLKDFSSTREFMNELIGKIKSGINFYAVYHVEQEYKFGKLCFDSNWNKMFMYSLSNSTFESDSQFIWFSDLKKCFLMKDMEKPFISFIEIPTSNPSMTEKIIICMNDAALSTQFMKICSGETGALYKGAKFVIKYGSFGIKPLLNVNEYVTGNNVKGCPVDYNLGLFFPAKTYKKGSFIVEGYTEGGFRIFKVLRDSILDNIIGQVLNEDLIQCLPNSKIIESGIAYSLE